MDFKINDECRDDVICIYFKRVAELEGLEIRYSNLTDAMFALRGAKEYEITCNSDNASQIKDLLQVGT